MQVHNIEIKMKISNWPEYKINEINAVKKILNSGKVNYWTGNENKKFEIIFKTFKIKKQLQFLMVLRVFIWL